MNESEFYKATQSRALKGPYLLHGEEELTKAEAVARVKKLLDPGMLALNCQSLQAPDAQTLLQAADQLPFFDEFRLVLVENWDDSPYVVGCITVYCGKTPIRLIDHIKYKS